MQTTVTSTRSHPLATVTTDPWRGISGNMPIEPYPKELLAHLRGSHNLDTRSRSHLGTIVEMDSDDDMPTGVRHKRPLPDGGHRVQRVAACVYVKHAQT